MPLIFGAPWPCIAKRLSYNLSTILSIFALLITLFIRLTNYALKSSVPTHLSSFPLRYPDSLFRVFGFNIMPVEVPTIPCLWLLLLSSGQFKISHLLSYHSSFSRPSFDFPPHYSSYSNLFLQSFCAVTSQPFKLAFWINALFTSSLLFFRSFIYI